MVLIICPIAGVGSRLYPLTRDKPKAMVKIAGKLVMDHIMEKLMNCFPNNTKICFIVGYCKEIIMDHLENKYEDYFELSFVEQIPIGFKSQYPFYSGLGDAVSLSSHHGYNEDCFIVLSDRYPLQGFNQIIEYAEVNNFDGVITASRVNHPERYGVIVAGIRNIIKELREKPDNHVSNLVVSGSYYLRKRVTNRFFDLLLEQAKQPLEKKKEHQITSGLQGLIDQGYRLGYYYMDQPILDFGNPEGLLQANRILLEKMQPNEKLVVQGSNVKLDNTNIGKYLSIGDNVGLNNCTITNAIVGDNCHIENKLLKNIIVDNDTNMDNFEERTIQL